MTVRKYDAIILTYSIHHLTSKNKLELIVSLLPLLNDGGKIYIGDVMFESTGEMEKCARECGDEWDDDEIYLVIDEMKSIFPCKFEFIKMSYCAGVVIAENGSNMRGQG